MKKFTLLFAVCLTVLGFQAVFADDAAEIARAAKRGTTNTVTVAATRQKSDAMTSPILTGASRSSSAAMSAAVGASTNARITTPREGVVVSTEKSRATQVTSSASAITPRAGSVQSRATTNQKTSDRVMGVARSTVAPVASAPSRTGISDTLRPASIGRSAKIPTTSTARSATGTNTSRAAAINTEAAAALASTDYKKCREVFYSCMDEFCAAKDTQLKRCACSSRIHDFDNVKKKMTDVEDKMLTFNERLLTVNMDKEDAAAISKATEGETAYQKDDKSSSKKILDEIAKKLKSSTADSDMTRTMGAINLSLDMDSAFDNIDSLQGASTATKEGTALYNAALPICKEMVLEVCDEEGASMAESAYLMAIEQDCNTVSKAYSTMQDQALEKVREGAALLDISRLDIHQQRNSDDILTCKKKMLDMLSNSSVCGTNLGKCLDTTGKYIDPSTGEAFLTVNLSDLDTLIVRPTGDQKWTSVTNNQSFVTYLNSKKKYLEPAMENCQDIADRVWTEFMEDALAQIKLAQERKLEDMRQSCTSLTTQCLSTTATSISEFDARALSVFGVSADKTVNAMCAGIKTACTALLESTGGDTNWVGGMTEIETDKTYDTIIQTCREVGRACIIQTCKSISGNFGLCESIEKSVNRKSIINRTACWDEVVQCVQNSGDDSIKRIMEEKFNKTPGATDYNFYAENYGSLGKVTNGGDACDPTSQSCVYDICANCDTPGYASCATCRLAEKIWGNCEFVQTKDLVTGQNMIKMPEDDANKTLLSWFATNTGTAKRIDSCKDTSCPAGWRSVTNQATGNTTCELASNTTSDGLVCTPDQQFEVVKDPNNKWTNCAITNPRSADEDYSGNICARVVSVTGFVGRSTALANTNYFNPLYNTTKVCAPATGGVEFAAAFQADGTLYATGEKSRRILLCMGSTTGDDITATYPKGQTKKCSGHYVIIDEDTGAYISPNYNDGASTQLPIYPYNYFNLDSNTISVCVYNSQTKTWGTFNSDSTWGGENPACAAQIPGPPKYDDNNAFIKFEPAP